MAVCRFLPPCCFFGETETKGLPEIPIQSLQPPPGRPSGAAACIACGIEGGRLPQKDLIQQPCPYMITKSFFSYSGCTEFPASNGRIPHASPYWYENMKGRFSCQDPSLFHYPEFPVKNWHISHASPYWYENMKGYSPVRMHSSSLT